MNPSRNPALAAAAVFGFFGVALGAFGAHALKALFSPQALDWWTTGVHYHLVHAGALAVASLALGPGPGRRWAVGAFSLGILLFSGSLYLLALTGLRPLGAVTPLGGVAFLVGWAALAWTAGRGSPLYRKGRDQ